MWILSRAYVNSHFSREQAGESSADIYLIGEPSARWKSTLTPCPSSHKDKTTTPSNHSLFGAMSARLTENLGKEKSTSSLADFLAKTSLAQAKAQVSKTDIVPVFGVSLQESFAKFDHTTRSWKIPHCLFDAELKSFSEIFPKWGMMLRGVCSELTMSELRTQEKEYGCSQKVGTTTAQMGTDVGKNRYLTPMATDGLRSKIPQKSLAKRFAKHPNGNLSEQIAHKESANAENASGGALSPQWVEWLMGWQIGWTDLGVSATDKSHFAPQPPPSSSNKS